MAVNTVRDLDINVASNCIDKKTDPHSVCETKAVYI